MFYLNVRRALLHPGCNPTLGLPEPESLEDYQKMPSRKVDTMVQIIKHHLAKTCARPLKLVTPPPQSDSSEEVIVAFEENMERPEVDVTDMPPDRIIIYSFFIGNFPLIEQVSHSVIYFA